MTLLTPPDAEKPSAPIVLDAPPAVEIVQEDAATGMLPEVDPSRKLEIGNQAKGFVTDLVKFNPNDPAFAAKISDIQNLAQKEIVIAGAGTSRLLERKQSSVAGAKASGGDATIRVANTLADLRNTVTDLTPNAADLTGVQKFLGFIPGGKKITRYFRKYESAQAQLDNIVKSLLAGQDELQKDNASLQQEKQNQWNTMLQLREYIVLAEGIDREIVLEIERLKQSGNLQAANQIETDMLFVVRQRHQDLLTQLAVSVQGYMAMELVRKNNVELIKGVDRARTTTITALRTAVIVAQALDTQKLVLDQIDAVNEATNKTILATSAMLKQNTTRVHEQATNSGVSVETLTKAFDDIFSTMDAIDTFKAEANAKMEVTIGALSAQLDRAKPQLERARALEAGETGKALEA